MVFNLLLFFCFFFPFMPALKGKEERIALLFLTIREPNHAGLWKQLLAEANHPFTLYVHSKEAFEDPVFAPRRIAHIVPTSWSVHVKAWQELIKEALKDPDTGRFVFLSESCVPLYSLDYIYETICKEKESHMQFAGPWWPESSSRHVFELDAPYRLGNGEWVVLNRKHAEIVAGDRAIIRIISKHDCDQESYFASLFSVYDILHEFRNFSYTYTNWRYAEGGGSHPYTFREVTPFNDALLAEAYRSGALFARKFARTYPESALLERIREHTP